MWKENHGIISGGAGRVKKRKEARGEGFLVVLWEYVNEKRMKGCNSTGKVMKRNLTTTQNERLGKQKQRDKKDSLYNDKQSDEE